MACARRRSSPSPTINACLGAACAPTRWHAPAGPWAKGGKGGPNTTAGRAGAWWIGMTRETARTATPTPIDGADRQLRPQPAEPRLRVHGRRSRVLRDHHSGRTRRGRHVTGRDRGNGAWISSNSIDRPIELIDRSIAQSIRFDHALAHISTKKIRHLGL